MLFQKKIHEKKLRGNNVFYQMLGLSVSATMLDLRAFDAYCKLKIEYFYSGLSHFLAKLIYSIILAWFFQIAIKIIKTPHGDGNSFKPFRPNITIFIKIIKTKNNPEEKCPPAFSNKFCEAILYHEA